ncbi:MAG: GTPase Era [Dethiobacteria bacterium]|nr:GTPase Era [Bacillota bacterium]HOJ84631.1 GTPase Era [Bacillota bacterium]HOL15979.1 GTPase Era [Bacillota bacterium]
MTGKESKTHRSGFVALVGRPNVGKSTLLNSLLGQKIAIVSPKPQTTRTAIRAILTRDEMQVIFIDTPGLHRPRHELGRSMIRAARAALQESDLACFIVEAHCRPGPGDNHIAASLQETSGPVFLVLNKADLAAPEQLQSNRLLYRDLYPFADCFTLSALRGEGLEPLLNAIAACLPEGPRYYPPEMITDQPERFIAAEIIREKIIHLTREEIPHAIAVVVEEISPREGRELLDLRAHIFVERESQVGIVIGKGGRLLKDAGSAARREIEVLFGRQVYLDLRVKARRDWRNRERLLREWGYKET